LDLLHHDVSIHSAFEGIAVGMSNHKKYPNISLFQAFASHGSPQILLDLRAQQALRPMSRLRPPLQPRGLDDDELFIPLNYASSRHSVTPYP